MTEVRTSYLIGRADRVSRGLLEERLTGVLTLSEVTVLSVLTARPGLSNAGLARRALVSPQAMHKVVRSLEELGLVQRESSPGGGRSLNTTVTDKGRRVLEQAETLMAEGEDLFLTNLDADEQVQLRQLLLKLTAVEVSD